LDKGISFNYKEHTYKTSNGVISSSIIKKYFNTLQEPLIPFEYYDLLIAAENLKDEKEQRIKLIKNIINIIPKNNFNLLSELTLFLNNLSLIENFKNKSKNLGNSFLFLI
jgi:hypothetical protein